MEEENQQLDFHKLFATLGWCTPKKHIGSQLEKSKLGTDISVSFHLTELTKHDNSTNYTIQRSQIDLDNSLTYVQRFILHKTPWQDTFDSHRLSSSLDTTG